jgi:hypothetical protein
MRGRDEPPARPRSAQRADPTSKQDADVAGTGLDFKDKFNANAVDFSGGIQCFQAQ